MAAEPGHEGRLAAWHPRRAFGPARRYPRAWPCLLASDASSWITGALIPMDGGNLGYEWRRLASRRSGNE